MKKKQDPPINTGVTDKKNDPGGPVIRLRIEVKGNEWTIVRKVRVPKMVLPKQPSLPAAKGRVSGFWVDMIDRDDKLLYRVIRDNPLTGSKEVVSKNKKFVREAMTKDRILVEILLPEMEGMDKIRFFSDTDPGAKKALDKSKELKAPQRGGAQLIKEFSIKEL